MSQHGCHFSMMFTLDMLKDAQAQKYAQDTSEVRPDMIMQIIVYIEAICPTLVLESVQHSKVSYISKFTTQYLTNKHWTWRATILKDKHDCQSIKQDGIHALTHLSNTPTSPYKFVHNSTSLLQCCAIVKHATCALGFIPCYILSMKVGSEYMCSSLHVHCTILACPSRMVNGR